MSTSKCAAKVLGPLTPEEVALEKHLSGALSDKKQWLMRQDE